jgi:CzcA family heavy metal efflux pump
MLALVRIALARPYTFVVMAIAILIVGVLAAVRTPTDVFPDIPVPVIAVAFTYTGLAPSEVSGRILTSYQRNLTTNVNDIEHMESTSYPGLGIVKIFFHPGADITLANAQITAASQATLRQLPPNITPPLLINYSASTVPVLQLALAGEGLSEQQLSDLGANVIRTRLVSVNGASIPQPYGGRTRQIVIDLNPQALAAHGLSAADVSVAVGAQTQITPGGFVKIGEFQYNLRLNNAPGSVDSLNDLPIKTIDGATIRIGDVANVRDGAAIQQNIVHVNGVRSTLLTVFKNGSVSTIAVVNGIRAMLPDLRPLLPDALTITPMIDQSQFVRAAVDAVLHEGVLAAVLTSLMILLFLGSWRSTVIIATSIPLAVLSAIAALAAFGQTFNIMTLGGLALAIGILVDDATVTIENIESHLEQGKDVRSAILDGGAQIVTPAFVSLLCICIVFVPMFFLPGISGFLFVPMAMSVVFAMVASFILSRTLVPTMAMALLRPHVHGENQEPSNRRIVRFQKRFEAGFQRLRGSYAGVLGYALRRRGAFAGGVLSVALLSLCLVPFLGRNFFPAVDAGAITLHIRGPSGMRLEETAALSEQVQQVIRQVIPRSEIETVVDNVGLPQSPLNVVYNASGTIGPADGDILVGLKKGHQPTADYIRELRHRLPKEFPQATFSFLPSDVTSQILNFGSPAPIDIQITGGKGTENMAYGQKVLAAIRGVKGLADARIQQPIGAPELRFDADRTRMSAMGLTEANVTSGVAAALAGSSQSSPVFWLSPENGVSYPVVAQAPEYFVDGLDKLASLPIVGAGGGDHTLGALGTFSRGAGAAVVNQYNIAPSINVYGAIQDRDLGAVAADVEKILKSLEKDKPKTVKIEMRGQYETMNAAFGGMAFGLLGAVVMIYLLVVVNFQSWTDPLVIISALPSALAGIAWMLFATGTPLSVPALTGAIMCMGVATANSILIVSFARERLAIVGDAVQAAYEAGVARFRPVIMTALAMIIGMSPMALALGEGAEQNAPLGRAVIGGLIFATCASLLFVPVVFAIAHRKSRPTDDNQGLAA